MNALFEIDRFLAIYVNDLLFWVVLFYLAWNLYILLFNRGIPNIRTAPSIRKLMAEQIKAMDPPPRTIMDIGCGNGKLTRYLAREFPHAHIIGVEIAHKSYLWARMMQRLGGLKNITYIRGDFFAQDISDVDVIVMYFSPYYMHRFKDKVTADLKAGAYILSNRFEMPRNHGNPWPAERSIDAPNIGRVESLLHPFQKTLHIYRKPL